jgi:o-succinylbenzoate synthase
VNQENRNMNVDRITLREIRLPLREPFRISSGVVAERRILLAEVVSADGLAVWSECVAGELPNYSCETIDTAWLALREWFGPRLLQADLEHPAAADALLARDVRGHRMARATLEMALWALHAEQQASSLARVLGGTRDHIDVGISLGIQTSPAELADRVADAVAAGYAKIKLKIEPGADIDYVAAARARVGAAAPLMVDANNAYTLADAAQLARLDEFDLIMIEQPLDSDDLVRHAALQRRLRTPLCLDESITSIERADDMIRLGSGRIINIKPGRVGGFAQAMAIHDLCARHGVPVWCGGMLESGVGRAYNVALASLPNFTIAGDISPSSRYWEHDIVTPAWEMSEPGRMAVPHGRAGIGVAVDQDRVDRLTVRMDVLRRGSRAGHTT